MRVLKGILPYDFYRLISRQIIDNQVFFMGI